MVYPPPRRPRQWAPFAVLEFLASDWPAVHAAAYEDEHGERRVWTAGRGEVARRVLRFLTSAAAHTPFVHTTAGRALDARILLAAADRMGWPWHAMGGAGPLVAAAITDPATGREVRVIDGARFLPEDPDRLFPWRIDRLNSAEDYALRPRAAVAALRRSVGETLAAMGRVRAALMGVGAFEGGATLAGAAARWVRASRPLRSRRLYVWEAVGGGYRPTPDFACAELLAREAYRGGRAFCDHAGLAPGAVYAYDLRSAYPWAMLQCLPAYPAEMEGPTDDPAEILRRVSLAGFSRAEVECPEGLAWPVLPRRDTRDTARLEFPRETFAGTFVHAELAEAVRQGYRVRLLLSQRWIVHPWLRKFVRTFYPLRDRLRHDPVVAYAVKVFLNSITGRLAEQDARERIVTGDVYERRVLEDAHGAGGHPHFKVLTARVREALWTERGAAVHVAAAATLTALVRLRLLAFVEALERAGARVYYGATDCVMCDLPPERLGALLRRKPGLGDWTHRGTYVEAEFRGPMCYRLKGADGREVYRVKGARIASFGDWLDYHATDGKGVSHEGYRGLREDLRGGKVAPTARAWSVRSTALDDEGESE